MERWSRTSAKVGDLERGISNESFFEGGFELRRILLDEGGGIVESGVGAIGIGLGDAVEELRGAGERLAEEGKHLGGLRGRQGGHSFLHALRRRGKWRGRWRQRRWCGRLLCGRTLKRPDGSGERRKTGSRNWFHAGRRRSIGDRWLLR